MTGTGASHQAGVVLPARPSRVSFHTPASSSSPAPDTTRDSTTPTRRDLLTRPNSTTESNRPRPPSRPGLLTINRRGQCSRRPDSDASAGASAHEVTLPRAGDYGRVIELARRAAPMAQRQLGDACGLSQSAVSRRKACPYGSSGPKAQPGTDSPSATGCCPAREHVTSSPAWSPRPPPPSLWSRRTTSALACTRSSCTGRTTRSCASSTRAASCTTTRSRAEVPATRKDRLAVSLVVGSVPRCVTL